MLVLLPGRIFCVFIVHVILKGTYYSLKIFIDWVAKCIATTVNEFVNLEYDMHYSTRTDFNKYHMLNLLIHIIASTFCYYAQQ